VVQAARPQPRAQETAWHAGMKNVMTDDSLPRWLLKNLAYIRDNYGSCTPDIFDEHGEPSKAKMTAMFESDLTYKLWKCRGIGHGAWRELKKWCGIPEEERRYRPGTATRIWPPLWLSTGAYRFLENVGLVQDGKWEEKARKALIVMLENGTASKHRGIGFQTLNEIREFAGLPALPRKSAQLCPHCRKPINQKPTT
jgi:hypothetical protein